MPHFKLEEKTRLHKPEIIRRHNEVVNLLDAAQKVVGAHGATIARQSTEIKSLLHENYDLRQELVETRQSQLDLTTRIEKFDGKVRNLRERIAEASLITACGVMIIGLMFFVLR